MPAVPGLHSCPHIQPNRLRTSFRQNEISRQNESTVYHILEKIESFSALKKFNTSTILHPDTHRSSFHARLLFNVALSLYSMSVGGRKYTNGDIIYNASRDKQTCVDKLRADHQYFRTTTKYFPAKNRIAL